MLESIDWLLILLLCGYAFYLGYRIAEVKDNNYSELFQGYIKRNTELEYDLYYWRDTYRKLLHSIPDELIEDKVVDARMNTVGVYLKKEFYEE